MATEELLVASAILANGNIGQVVGEFDGLGFALGNGFRAIVRNGKTGELLTDFPIPIPAPQTSIEGIGIAGVLSIVPDADGGFFVPVFQFAGPLKLTRVSADGIPGILDDFVRIDGDEEFFLPTGRGETADGGFLINGIASFDPDTSDHPPEFAEIFGTGEFRISPLPEIDPDATGIPLKNGNLLFISNGVNTTERTIQLFDPDLNFLGERTEPLADLENAVARVSGSPLKIEELPLSNKFVGVWQQFQGPVLNPGPDVPFVPENSPTGLFLGFGDLLGENTLDGLSNVTRITSDLTDRILGGSFDIMALPDGSFIVGWIARLRVGEQGASMLESQAFWQHFDADGIALNEAQSVGPAAQQERGVFIEPLEAGKFLLTTHVLEDIDDRGMLDAFEFSVDLNPVVDVLSDSSDQFIGNREVQVVLGLSGNDIIETRAAADVVQAGAGDDTVNAGTGDDSIDGGLGNDLLLGFSGDDTLDGGAGDDTLVGGSGADRLVGGAGSDVADYSAANNRVFADLQNMTDGIGEAAGDFYFGVEHLVGTGQSDFLRGNAVGNHLAGGTGSDRLYGRGGDDTLKGEAGVDKLYGNAGSDIMSGGLGADRFIYYQLSDSRAGVDERDTITDFAAGEDRIELRWIDADTTAAGNQGFDFIGKAGFSGKAGELRFFQAGNDQRSVVLADADGDRIADFEIELLGEIPLTEEDFLL
ncbi:MAG: calcium-binding protein [Pseudomonadota bacterium]